MKNRKGYAEGDRRRTLLVRRGWPSAYAMPRVAVGLTDGTVSAPSVLAGMCHASACYAEGRHYAEGDRRCSVYYADGLATPRAGQLGWPGAVLRRRPRRLAVGVSDHSCSAYKLTT